MESPDNSSFGRKLENFWYYHKMKIILPLLAIMIFMVWFVAFRSDTTPADVSVVLWGVSEVDSAMTEKLNQVLSSSIKDVNNDGVHNLALLPSSFAQKAYLMLASGQAQVAILDGSQFRIYAAEGTFRPLDDLVKKCSFDIGSNPEIKMSTEQDKTEHIYGIPLAGNRLLAKMGVDISNTYIAINASSEGKDNKMIDNGFALLEALMKNK